MKTLLAVVLVLVFSGFVFAQSDAELLTQKSLAQIAIIQLRAQRDYLRAELDEYLSKYSQKLADFKNTETSLTKAIGDINKKLKALETANQPKSE